MGTECGSLNGLDVAIRRVHILAFRVLFFCFVHYIVFVLLIVFYRINDVVHFATKRLLCVDGRAMKIRQWKYKW